MIRLSRGNKNLERNGPCGCGEARKYKKCCQRLEIERRGGPQQYRHLSARGVVLEEIRSFKQIFGIDLTDSKVRVREEIVNSDVVLFVERVRNLWNSRVDLLSEIPNKEDLKFRALYFGSPDMFSTVNLLARYTLYCDQIIAIDPFSIFCEVDPKSRRSPFQDPQSWVRQIVRDGLYLCSIEKWIESDLVLVTRLPLTLHDGLRREHRLAMKASLEKMAPEKFAEIVQDTVEGQFYSQFTPDELRTMLPKTSDFETIRRAIEDEDWWNHVSPHMPEISKEIVRETLRDMNRRKGQIEETIKGLQSEPRRIEWALEREFEPRVNVFGSGMNLLDARWLAEKTGAHLVTDRRVIWNEILAGETENREPQSEKLRQSLSGLAEAFQKLELLILRVQAISELLNHG